MAKEQRTNIVCLHFSYLMVLFNKKFGEALWELERYGALGQQLFDDDQGWHRLLLAKEVLGSDEVLLHELCLLFHYKLN